MQLSAGIDIANSYALRENCPHCVCAEDNFFDL
jgi:hypothetical protein